MRQFVQLLKLTVVQAMRTRFVLAFVVFGLFTQVAGMYLVANATLKFDLVVSKVGPKHALFIAMFLNLLSGFFLSIVYGTWMIPHAHSGVRGELTFSLPIAKWKYPLAYLVSLLLFFAVQGLLVLTIFGTVFGVAAFSAEGVPWIRALMCFAIQSVAFSVVAFGFALGSMFLGTILTLFCGATFIFLLQVLGALLRLPVDQWLGLSVISNLGKYYQWFPPFGDLVFELRRTYFTGLEPGASFGSMVTEWSIWLVLCYGLLWWRIAHPPRFRSSDI